MACLIPTTSLFIIALLFTSGLCERIMQEGEMKDPKRCLEGLGPCSIAHCDETCCKKQCNNYYSGANPYGYCDKHAGFPGYICLCEHDCGQKA